LNDRAACSALYFLAGGLAGASVALLLAPRSGREARESMRRRLREASANAKRSPTSSMRGAHDEAGTARGLKERFLRRGEEIRKESLRRAGGATSAPGAPGDERPSLP